jgi:hypothetical protein
MASWLGESPPSSTVGHDRRESLTKPAFGLDGYDRSFLPPLIADLTDLLAVFPVLGRPGDGSPLPIDVGPMVDVNDEDRPGIVVDSIEHSVWSPAGAVQAGKLTL